jgi:hypothetical protein
MKVWAPRNAEKSKTRERVGGEGLWFELYVVLTSCASSFLFRGGSCRGVLSEMMDEGRN